MLREVRSEKNTSVSSHLHVETNRKRKGNSRNRSDLWLPAVVGVEVGELGENGSKVDISSEEINKP